MKYFSALLILLQLTVSAQSIDFHKSNEFYRKAVNSYIEKDYHRFLMEIRLAEQYRQNHPRLLYNIAAGYALNNQTDSALVYLARVANMGLYVPAANDSDFVSMFENDKFSSIVAEFNQNTIPIQNSKKYFDYEEVDLIPESVAFDKQTNRYFISSVYKGKIISYSDGVFDEFYVPIDGDAFSLLGMKVDNENRELWVCAAGLPQSNNLDSAKIGKSKILAFDLDSNQLKNEFIVDDTLEHLFGDLEIADDASVYISDSKTNCIYLVRKEANSLDLFYEPEGVYSLQGIDSDSEGNLWIADYTTGIYKIELKTKNQIRIKSPQNLTTLGIDGLYIHEDFLLGIQNGVNPNRLIKMELNDERNAITDWSTIDSNHMFFDDPTLGVIVEDFFYYVANSNWNKFDRNGKIDRSLMLSQPVILKYQLD